MATWLRRWILFVVLGCVLAAVGLLPQPHLSDSHRSFAPLERSQRLQRAVLRTHRWLSWVQMGDSLSRLVQDSLTSGREGPFRILDPGLPTAARAIIDSSLDLVSAGLPKSLAVPISFGVVVDTTRRWDGLTIPAANSLVHFTPAAMAGRTCTAAIITRRPQVLGYPNHFPNRFLRDPEGIPGLCAYFSAFGAPGTDVRDWLESSDYVFARRPAWLVRHEEEPLLGLDQRYLTVVWIRFAPGLLACAQEDLESCRRLLLAGSDRRRSRHAPDGIYGSFGSHPFGDGAEELLSDLLLDLGPDRFARFWTSEADVEEAFSEAFGLRMERWAVQWARRKLHYHRYRPTPAPGSLALGLLISGVLVSVTAVWARRRQVG